MREGAARAEASDGQGGAASTVKPVGGTGGGATAVPVGGGGRGRERRSATGRLIQGSTGVFAVGRLDDE